MDWYIWFAVIIAVVIIIGYKSSKKEIMLVELKGAFAQ